MSCADPILASHNPNEGRAIINANFEALCELAFSGITGTTIVSGSSNIDSIQTGVSPLEYTVFLKDNVTTNSINASGITGTTIFASGLSANTLSGGTLFSGSTNLYSIFTTGAHTNVQPGTNIYTGGTSALPTINVSALTIDHITVSGASLFNTVSATTISANTIFASTISGMSPVNIEQVIIENGNLTALTVSASTFYSGSTDLSDLFLTSVPAVSYNIVVSGATGVNSYSGTASPSIVAYETDVIYLVSFLSANTSSATTLNIDSLGDVSILKGDETGLVGLDVGDIQPDINYYFTYDGTEFQFFTSSPAAIPSTYTNLNPVPATLGGVVIGTTFSATTYSGVFDMLFYPYLVPYFTAFSLRTGATSGSSIQNTNLEVGDSVSGGTRAFTWTTSNSSFVKPNSIIIRNVTAGNTIISTPTSGMTNDGFESIAISNVQKTTNTTHLWRVFATRTNNTTFYSNFQVNWFWRQHFGTSTATTLSASSMVTGLTSSSLASSFAGSKSFAAGGYKYITFPNSFGSPSLFKDNATQLAVAMATVADDPVYSNLANGNYYALLSVTNAFGISTSYRIYRSKNILGGSITIVVS